jgi:hypothetical protein
MWAWRPGGGICSVRTGSHILLWSLLHSQWPLSPSVCQHLSVFQEVRIFFLFWLNSGSCAC